MSFIEPSIMKFIFHVFILFLLSNAVTADETLRHSLNEQDFVLIRETDLKFNTCLQEKAMEKINEPLDIRQIAATAVDVCRIELEKLEKEFDESKLDPNFYQGLVNNIKTRAIRQLMPLLMMEKSRTQ